MKPFSNFRELFGDLLGIVFVIIGLIIFTGFWTNSEVRLFEDNLYIRGIETAGLWVLLALYLERLRDDYRNM